MLVERLVMRVHVITRRNEGVQVSSAVTAGSPIIPVYDTTPAFEDGGVLVLPSGAQQNYVGVDDVNLTLLLDTGAPDSGAMFSGLMEDLPADAFLPFYPPSPELYALCSEEDDDGDAVTARVAHGLWNKLTEGVRDVLDNQEVVAVEFDGEEWVVTDVLGQPPTVDASYIDTPTLQGPVQSLLEGPAPSVIVGVGAIAPGAVTAETLASLLTITQLVVVVSDPTQPNVGNRIEIGISQVDGSNGIRWYDANGTLVINLPVDGGVAAFGGNVSALGLVVQSATSFYGDVTLSSGVSDPTVGPTITRSYNALNLGTYNNVRQGVFYDPIGKATSSTTQPTFLLVENVLGGDLREYSAATGSNIRHASMGPGLTPIGVMRLGATVYVLCEGPHGEAYVSTFTQFGFVHMADIFTGEYNPLAIQTDGTNVLIAIRNDFGTLDVVSFPTSFTAMNSLTGTALNVFPPTDKIVRGWAILGVRWYFQVIELGNSYVHAVNSSTGVRVGSLDFSPSNKGGICYDGTNFWVAARTQAGIQQMTNWLPDGTNFGFQIRYAWVDGSGHETAISPSAQGYQDDRNGSYARSRVRVTVPPFPTGVTAVRIYWGEGGSTAPPLSAFIHVLDGSGVTSDIDVVAPNTTPTAIDATLITDTKTPFPIATPARLIAPGGVGNPTVILQGDGLWDATDFQPKSGNVVQGYMGMGIPGSVVTNGNQWDASVSLAPYSLLAGIVPATVTFGGTPTTDTNESNVAVVSRNSRGFCLRMTVGPTTGSLSRYANTYSFVAP